MRITLLVILLGLMPIGAYCEIASKGYVDEQVIDQVKTTGDQEISGTKTYSESPIVPTPPLP